MTRDAFVRMDIDTRLVYNKRFRALQRAHPADWANFGMAYIALLGEAWHGRSRDIKLEDAWPSALHCPLADARAALRTAGLIDRQDRIPIEAWEDWYGPAARRSQSAQNAAAIRWQDRTHARPQTDRYPNSLSNKPEQQAKPVARARGKDLGETNGGAPLDMKSAMKAAGFDPDAIKGGDATD